MLELGCHSGTGPAAKPTGMGPESRHVAMNMSGFRVRVRLAPPSPRNDEFVARNPRKIRPRRPSHRVVIPL
ncbi:hypothetical protein SAMN05216374_1236 [Tardiphaga sp. OK246]|nr:hypothetical protein SAMN05216374_1236 [Tardiphaga sp. OK246]